jgi:hypothetical protein
MPGYEIAQFEVRRLVNGPRGANGNFQPSFEAQLIAAYHEDRFRCAALARLELSARAINRECHRLLANHRFESKYSSMGAPKREMLAKAILQKPVSLEALIRIDDAISAICANGKKEFRDAMRKFFPNGALPDGSIELVGP